MHCGLNNLPPLIRAIEIPLSTIHFNTSLVNKAGYVNLHRYSVYLYGLELYSLFLELVLGIIIIANMHCTCTANPKAWNYVGQ